MTALSTPYISYFDWCGHLSRLCRWPLTMLTARKVLGMLLRSLTWVVSGTGRHNDPVLEKPCNGQPFVLSEGGQETSVEQDPLTFTLLLFPLWWHSRLMGKTNWEQWREKIYFLCFNMKSMRAAMTRAGYQTSICFWNKMCTLCFKLFFSQYDISWPMPIRWPIISNFCILKKISAHLFSA